MMSYREALIPRNTNLGDPLLFQRIHHHHHHHHNKLIRPLVPISSPNHNKMITNSYFNHLHHDHHHFGNNNNKGELEEGYNNKEGSAQQVMVSSRWNPTPEQLTALEELYRCGIRTPSADQIQLITTQLRRYGKIEGKNVFYWFQNHKARERQKRRRQNQLHLTTNVSKDKGFEEDEEEEEENCKRTPFMNNKESEVPMLKPIEGPRKSDVAAAAPWFKFQHNYYNNQNNNYNNYYNYNNILYCHKNNNNDSTLFLSCQQKNATWQSRVNTIQQNGQHKQQQNPNNSNPSPPLQLFQLSSSSSSSQELLTQSPEIDVDDDRDESNTVGLTLELFPVSKSGRDEDGNCEMKKDNASDEEDKIISCMVNNDDDGDDFVPYYHFL